MTATTSTRGVRISSTSTSSNSMALRISSPSRSVSSPSLSASDTMVISSPSVMASGSASLWKQWVTSLFHRPNRPVRGDSRGMKKRITGTEAVATFSGISRAMLRGPISPNSRMTTASATAETTVPRRAPRGRIKSRTPREAAARFAMVSPTRMVEKSLSRCCAMARTRAAPASPSSARLLSRISFREAKAVSTAEKKPDRAIRATMAARVRILPSSIMDKSTQLSESGIQKAPSIAGFRRWKALSASYDSILRRQLQAKQAILTACLRRVYARVKRLPSQSTVKVEPSANWPAMMALATTVSIRLWMNRWMGRAP